MLKACIGRNGAYFWNTETNQTSFVYTEGTDRSEEWRQLYATNKKQASIPYQDYALQFSKFAFEQKRRRDAGRAYDHAWRGTLLGGSYYPGQYRVGHMWPEASPEWRK